MNKRLLMISTDRKIFEEGSAVRARQAEYARGWKEVHIVVFAKRDFRSPISDLRSNSNLPLPREAVLSPNCFAYSTRSRSKFLYPFDAMRLGRFIMEKRGITDITCQDASLTAMAGVSLKKRFNGKISNAVTLEIQVHEDIGSPNYTFNWTNRIRKFLALNYLSKADSIRVVSERIKKYLVGTLGISESKVVVRPITIDVESIKSAPIIAGADLHKKYPRFDKIVLMAGRLEPEKNVKLALEAFAIVTKKIPKVGLAVFGTGSQERSLKKLSAKLGIEDSVIFGGWAGAALVSYYKTADLFLNTSLFEGYGMTLVEANAAGCPIVSTDIGVAKETGAAIVDWNAESVADGINEALSQTIRRASI
jgi:glycosyltransferase involved in cell wall biosynthesis